MNLKRELTERYKEQLRIISLLPNLELKFESIEIDCNLLVPISGRLKKAQYRVLYPCAELEERSGPVVYYFKLMSPENAEQVWKGLRSLKDEKICTCPQMSKSFVETNTETLYVGSERNSIMRRVAEHMSYAHKDTGGLQLTHWARLMNLKLELHFTCLVNVESGLIRHVEAVVARKLNPLVGKWEV